jgi:hypothetical protein
MKSRIKPNTIHLRLLKNTSWHDPLTTWGRQCEHLQKISPSTGAIHRGDVTNHGTRPIGVGVDRNGAQSNLWRVLCYRCDYELFLSPRRVFVTPASQRERASNAPHGCSPSVGVFLFALKQLHVLPHKSKYQVAGGKCVNIVRVGNRVCVVERPADVHLPL